MINSVFSQDILIDIISACLKENFKIALNMAEFFTFEEPYRLATDAAPAEA